MKGQKNKKLELIQEIVGNEFNDKIIIQDNKENKISQAILDFASPLLDECDNDKHFKRAISFSILVWNLCLSPEEERKKDIKGMLDACGNNLEEKQLWDNMINYFITRKEKYFSHDKRYVVNFKISKKNGKGNLTVAAMPDSD